MIYRTRQVLQIRIIGFAELTFLPTKSQIGITKAKEYEKFHNIYLCLKSGDVLFCEDMTTLAQNFKELHARIKKILTLNACVYFKKENMQFSNQRTKEIKNTGKTPVFLMFNNHYNLKS